MFDAFQHAIVDTGETKIDVRFAGSGPPLLLLHGFPQTKAIWAECAASLIEDFTVYAADLRGYGSSGKPPSTPDHESYSKRAMARDMVILMRHFGHERFHIAGHDRGGRVAYRLALDHPLSVLKLAVLDIIPTSDCYGHEPGMQFAMDYWHWYFLAQPAPFPEQVIALNPELVLFRGISLAGFSLQARAEYQQAIRDPEVVRAMCECYRAGATYDLVLDRADKGTRKIGVPLLVLWGDQGAVHRWGDVLEIWRGWADDIRGWPLDCGHYLPEEKPMETTVALREFFREPPVEAHPINQERGSLPTTGR